MRCRLARGRKNESLAPKVVTVEELDSRDLVNLTLLDRTELGITFTKVTGLS